MFKRSVSLVIALLLAWLIVASALAAVWMNGYTIERWTLDSGGGVSTEGRYSLTGSIGQPDASKAMTSGTYSLTAGYWGTANIHTMIFLPVVLRQSA